ncbi:MAG: rhodanese-like domain-containing protein [Chloroflexi bacterium]|nr:rhodanese-like domain-containing protein [Chloroflexota bacterium]
MEEVSRISPEEVKRLIDQNADVVLLDVRSPDAYDESSIKIRGAKRISPGEIASHLDEIPRDKLIVTY